jgi:hypothetical protein
MAGTERTNTVRQCKAAAPATLADNVAFERACQEGRALTLEQAIELA